MRRDAKGQGGRARTTESDGAGGGAQVDRIMEILNKERDPKAANKALSAVRNPPPLPLTHHTPLCPRPPGDLLRQSRAAERAVRPALSLIAAAGCC